MIATGVATEARARSKDSLAIETGSLT